MKIILLIIAFAFGLIMGVSMMSLMAAHKVDEAESNALYWQNVYETAKGELQNPSNTDSKSKNINFELKEE